MSLIGMAVYSTEENKKDECLRKTLQSLKDTVDFTKHRLMLSVNAQTKVTDSILVYYGEMIERVIYNDSNIGTAEAINLIWRERRYEEAAIKMDDDVKIYQEGWVDMMEEAIQRDNKIGIIGLKRRDLIQTTWHDDPHFRSEMIMLPHTPGQKWVTVERTGDVIGTATMYNPEFLKVIGFLEQIKKYGYDDSIACHKANLSGFYNCFLCGVDIEHLDEGATPYQAWKHKHSSECTEAYIKLVHDMIEKRRGVYYNPFEK